MVFVSVDDIKKKLTTKKKDVKKKIIKINISFMNTNYFCC